jgi:hypothetical protein
MTGNIPSLGCGLPRGAFGEVLSAGLVSAGARAKLDQQLQALLIDEGERRAMGFHATRLVIRGESRDDNQLADGVAETLGGIRS